MSSMPKSIEIKLKATHFNYINKNSLFYADSAVNEGAQSWITPFSKPHLVGHDKLSDPIGRITSYKIVRTKDTVEPPDYIELTAKITDSKAIEKILDGRYYTVSVGSKTSRVLCSECSQVITEDGLCEHQKGSFNEKGKPIYWIIEQIRYSECSFVNEPADEFARIVGINIGKGWVAYKEFLDNIQTILNEIVMEDKIMSNTEKKLSSEQRQNLPDSAFYYVATQDGQKVRKFPAHDAAHVRNGLAHLPQAKLSTGVKSKILSGLKRRAGKYNIDVGKDSIPEGEETQTWTAEEMTEMDSFFKENPDFDNLSEATATTPVDDKEIQDMKRAELMDFIMEMRTTHKTEVDTQAKKVTELEDKLKLKDTILSERDNEINKFMDQKTQLEKNYKIAIINNIIDLKMTDNINKEQVTALQDKLQARSLESLLDSLVDLREVRKQAKVEDAEKVINPANPPVTEKPKDKDPLTSDRFAVFSQKRTTVEVE